MATLLPEAMLLDAITYVALLTQNLNLRGKQCVVDLQSGYCSQGSAQPFRPWFVAHGQRGKCPGIGG